MVLFDDLESRKLICFMLGAMLGGGVMIYLYGIPTVAFNLAHGYSQVFSMMAMGITFISMNVAALSGLVLKAIFVDRRHFL